MLGRGIKPLLSRLGGFLLLAANFARFTGAIGVSSLEKGQLGATQRFATFRLHA